MKYFFNLKVMAIGLYPENITETTKSLWSLVDDILFALKDKSTEVFQEKKKKKLKYIF